MITLSLNGQHELRNLERLRLEVYDDRTGKTLRPGQKPIGYPTVGYGHKLPKDWEHTLYAGGISRDKAEELFQNDLHHFERAASDIINPQIQAKLNQNQKDALLLFIFNIGIGNFSKSTARKVLNASIFSLVPGAMKMWVRDDFGINSGLITRREHEAGLFKTPV